MNHSLQNNEEKIDLKVFFDRYLIFWKYIFLSIIFFLIIGFLYNRYSTKIYKSSTTLLIKEESNNSLGSDDVFEGLDLFGGQKNIKNEIGILESFSLTKKTLQDLNFRISYYHSGNLKSDDIYKKTPFIIDVDEYHPQLINQKFNIKLISEDEFILTANFDNVKLFNLSTETYVSNKELDINYDALHKFDEIIKTDFFNFSISKNDLSLFKDENWSNYFFVISSYNELTEIYRKKLEVIEIEKDASILKISLEGPNAVKINDFLNKFTELYLAKDLDEKNQITSNTIQFINQQLTSISDSLSNVESTLENFKEKNPKIELSQKEYGAFYQLEKLEQEKAILELNNKYYVSLEEYLLKNNNVNNIVAPSTMGIEDLLLNNHISELTKLYSQLNEVSVNSKQEHPLVISLKEQIKNTKEKLIENIDNVISSSDLTLKDINLRISEIEGLIGNLPQNERILLNIQRKFNLNENIYNYLLEKRAEASITKASNISDHKIIDMPRLVSNLPIRPNTLLIYFFSIIIGIFFPTILISLYFLFNNKIIDKKDIDQITSIPLLGKIMHNNSGYNLVNINSPKSGIAEAFRSIRTNIQYLASDKSQKVICITSSIGGEGKTFVAMNLASIFSITQGKTILIGADMRKPKIFNDFKLANDIGLSSYLSSQNSKEEVIQNTEFENLDIILSGPIPPNPSELLSLNKMEEFIKELKKTYQNIIIDTPPIGLVTDGLILMNHSDVNIYVIRQNFTTKDMLNNFNETIIKNNVVNMNLVINDISIDKNSYGYGYGYGNTYGYGYYTEDQSLDNKPWWKIKI
tara:strand:- start:10651 stop:13071 length:2421 start_codon:yes stop_codon:yes gene_type:complete